jgi:hypothetical protein
VKEKLKIIVFSVNYWNDEPPFLYNQWKNRVKKYINYDEIFIAPGTYSDPKVLNDDIKVVQINLPLTKDYNKNWSYYHSAFLTALYHILLNHPDFDVAVHVQGSVLLNTDLNSYIEQFYNRKEILAAPRLSCEMGCYIETGLMFLKKEAMIKFVTQPLRPSLTTQEVMNVEEEAFYLFHDDWWNFLPEVLTIRKMDTTVIETKIKGPFDLLDDDFYESPIIMTSGHASIIDIKNWIDKNPI